MKKMMITATILLLMLCFNNVSYARPMDANMIKEQMIKDWKRAKDFTKEYLDAMPADKYGFKAVDSIRSFAQQMLHLANGTVFLSGSALDQKSIFTTNLEASPTAVTKDSVTYYVMASYDFVINGLQKLDAIKLNEKVSLMNFSEPRYVLIDKAFEHQTHHRGQATIYIRLVGIRPPGEKLF